MVFRALGLPSAFDYVDSPHESLSATILRTAAERDRRREAHSTDDEARRPHPFQTCPSAHRGLGRMILGEVSPAVRSGGCHGWPLQVADELPESRRLSGLSRDRK